MTEHPACEPDTQRADFPVVAIGASAGGVEQLKALLQEIPDDTGAAFVVLLHLAPDQASQLATLLGRSSPLEVVAIEHDMPLARNRVHVIPAGYSLGLQHHRLQLIATESHRDVTRVIDGFFRALASACGGAAVGIVLSGSGSDGALGLKAIKMNGGLAMAQNPGEAEYDSMPRAAARTVALDYALGTTALARPLVNHLRRNFHEHRAGSDPTTPEIEVSDSQLDAILATLRTRKNYNFASYKPNMLKRRVRRRMGLNGLDDVTEYTRMLADDERECVTLGRDFLISVTDFFRDPEAYSRLVELAIAPLLQAREADGPLRIWVPGCATGEEAYSIAMIVAETIEANGAGNGNGNGNGNGKNRDFVVFASDIDDYALDFARSALYPESIVSDVGEQRLRRFFERVDHHYRVRRSLRERVVFAAQNVIEDPPYSGLDLVSCRNLLMYLKPETQKRVLGIFHFALNNDGFLALGNSETVGEEIDLFEPVGDQRRLFRRIGPTQRARTQLPFAHRPTSRLPGRDPAGPSDTPRDDDVEKIARDILLARHVPAAILINRKLEILCGYGPTGDYFALPFGQSSLGAIDMVHARFRSALRAVTHRAFRDDKSCDITAPTAHDDSATVRIDAQPLASPESARGLVLVTFTRTPLPDSDKPPLPPASDEVQQRLSEELDDTRAELQTTIAALEASNEDMQGSNEEILSMNEELQSANEELETSTEELQSVNEELATVNSELENKVIELETAHNDLDNLLAGTQVATLFLDRTLSIQRFTPAIQDVLNIVTTDVGRSIDEIKFKVDDPELIADADAVIEHLAPSEREVRGDSGAWYLRRILPYRTQRDRIEGVIVTYVDISTLMQLTLDKGESERRLDLALSAIDGGIWDIELDPAAPEDLPDAIYLSARFKSLLGFADEQMASSLHGWRERIAAEDRAAVTDIKTLLRAGAHSGLHYRIQHRDGSLRWFSSHGRMVHDQHGAPVRWIGVDFDITDSQQRGLDAQRSLEQLRLLANAIPWPVAFIDTEHRLPFVNTAWDDWFGAAAPARPAARPLADALGESADETLTPCVDAALAGRLVSCDLTLARAGYGEHVLQASLVPHEVDGVMLGCYLLMIDTSDSAQRDAERLGRHSGLVYLQRMATLGEMAGTLAHDLRQPLTAINTYAATVTRMLHAGKPADETAAMLRKIADQVTHADDIINNTRDFLGRRETGTEPVDLNAIVERALALTEGMARQRNVEHRLDLHTPLPETACYAIQIEQVIINLIINALDAMDSVERSARTLWLSTHQPDPGHIELTIQDSGEGIAAARIGRIFDTFHTSKLEGLGVGLSLGRAIVEDHGGELWAESPSGQGAMFYLRLPVVAGQTNASGEPE